MWAKCFRRSGFTLLNILICTTGYAQDFRKGEWTSCGKVIHTAHQRKALLTRSQKATVGMFEVTAIDLPIAALPPLESALSIWNEKVASPIPVKIKLQWLHLGGTFLAQSQPVEYAKNFRPNGPDAIWYPVALAEKIAGKELNDPDDFEIEINLNQDANWYLGTDGHPSADEYDLLSILLHEIAHGLGFLSSAMEVENGISLSADPDFSIYDHLLVTGDGSRLFTFNADPSRLKELSTSGDVYIYAPSANESPLHKCFAPSDFLKGISLSHLDHDPSKDDVLMTPFITPGWSLHTIDYKTAAIIMNMGWQENASHVINVYPNPVTDLLQIEIPSALDEFRVNLYNLQGQIIFSRRASKPLHPVFTIDTSTYPDGIYFFIIYQNFFPHPPVKIIINH